MSVNKADNILDNLEGEQESAEFESEKIEQTDDNDKEKESIVEIAHRRQVKKLTAEAEEIYSQYRAKKITDWARQEEPLPSIPAVLTGSQIREKRLAVQSFSSKLIDKLAFLVSKKSAEHKQRLEDLKYYFSNEISPVVIKREMVDVADVETIIQKYQADGYELIDQNQYYGIEKFHLEFVKKIEIGFEHEKNLSLLLGSSNDPIEIIERLKIILPSFTNYRGKTEHQLMEWLGNFLEEEHNYEYSWHKSSFDFNNSNLIEVLSMLNQIDFTTDSSSNLSYLSYICEPETFKKINDQKIAELLEIQKQIEGKIGIRGVGYILSKDSLVDQDNKLFICLVNLFEKNEDYALRKIIEIEESGLLVIAEKIISANIYYPEKVFGKLFQYSNEEVIENLKNIQDSEINKNQSLFEFAHKLNVLAGFQINPENNEDLEILKELFVRSETLAVALALKTINVTKLEKNKFDSLKNLKMIMDDQEVIEYLLADDTLNFFTALKEKYQVKFRYEDVAPMFGGHTKHRESNDPFKSVRPEGLASITTNQSRDSLLSDKTSELYEQFKKHFKTELSINDFRALIRISWESEKWNQIFNNPDFIIMIKTCFNSLSLKNLEVAASVEPSLLPTIMQLHEYFDYKMDYYNNFAAKLFEKSQDKIKELFNPERMALVHKLGILLKDYRSTSKFGFDPIDIDIYLEFPIKCQPVIDVLIDYPNLWKGMNKTTLMKSLEKFNLIIDSGLVTDLRENADNKDLQKLIMDNYCQLAEIEPRKRMDYVKAMGQIDSSPSQEIQRLKNSLLQQIIETEKPLETLDQVEQVFIKNNLPLVGKIYKIFEILHPPTVLQEKIKKAYSPTLKRQKTRGALRTIFTDLMSVHIDSGNRSLRNYLEIMASGENIIKQAEEQGFENLSSDQQIELKVFFAKLETLFENSQLGRHEIKPLINVEPMESYQNLKDSLKVKPGQTLTERVTDMFLRPIGAKDISTILKRMKTAKEQANDRNLKVAKIAKDGYLELAEGDLLKGVDGQYLANILQNGSVSKEFLSGLADSDLTPLDTDLSMVLPEDFLSDSDKKNRFSLAYDLSIARGYGNVLLVYKNRGQFESTPNKKPVGELFPSPVMGKHHFGVRTGISSTEIDIIVITSSEKQEKERIFFEIVKNGFYIPVTDAAGRILFTPAQYKKLRKTFSGLERFDGDPLKIEKAKNLDRHFSDISKIKKQAVKIEKATALTSKTISKTIENLFRELNLNFKQKFETSILGARLEDIGSTGRGTNLDIAADFDLILRLDARDFPSASWLAQSFIEHCRFIKDNSHDDNEGYFQLRLSGVSAIGEEKIDPPIDLDIGFAKNSELEVFGSHEAVKEKLDYIGQNQGEDFRKEVIANIILAKKVLKAGGVYKKLEEKGLGGIGVETWILQNSGSFLRAAESFLKSARPKKNIKSLERFQDEYKILDPGINVKKQRHDDFVRNLSEESYKKMISILSDYLEGRIKIE